MEDAFPVAPVAQPAELDDYAFVMNVARLTDADSYTLARGCVLRRASPNEVALVKRTLASVLGPSTHFRYQFLWEMSLPHPGGRIESLPETEWRYFIISFKGPNRTLAELERTFDLTRLEFEVGFTAMAEAGGYHTLWDPGRLFHVLENANPTDFFVDVSDNDVDEIRAIHFATSAAQSQVGGRSTSGASARPAQGSSPQI